MRPLMPLTIEKWSMLRKKEDNAKFDSNANWDFQDQYAEAPRLSDFYHHYL